MNRRQRHRIANALDCRLISRSERVALQQGLCFLCRLPLDGGATYDHVLPLAHGGTEHYRNKVLAHGKCNNEKGDRMPTAEELDRLAELWRGYLPRGLFVHASERAMFTLADVWPI